MVIELDDLIKITDYKLNKAYIALKAAKEANNGDMDALVTCEFEVTYFRKLAEALRQLQDMRA